MLDDTLPYELLTLVGSVALFDTWERRRPARLIDKRRDLSLDVVALLVVAVAGTLVKVLIRQGFDATGLHAGFTKLGILAGAASFARIAAGIIAADFALYWLHRWMHDVPLLWKSHRFHHTIRDLYWLSGARTSVTHLFLFAIPQVLIAREILALSPVESAIAFGIGVVVNIWVHTNLNVDLGPLQWLIITPAFHRVHHGRDFMPSRNIGFMLTIWDRAFGTYLDPRSVPDDYPLGLSPKDEVPLPRMVAGV